MRTALLPLALLLALPSLPGLSSLEAPAWARSSKSKPARSKSRSRSKGKAVAEAPGEAPAAEPEGPALSPEALRTAEARLLEMATPPPPALLALGKVQARLRKFDEAVKSYERYLQAETDRAKLAGATAELAGVKAALETRLSVASEPAGATLYLDGKEWGAVGVTPLAVQVKPGKHQVLLELAEHQSVRFELDVAARATRDLPLTLLPRPCALKVESAAAASVFIDGKPAGQTPLQTELPPGRYRIAAAPAGDSPAPPAPAVPATQRVTCAAGAPLAVRL